MKKIYEGDIRKNFFAFAVPLILAALMSQGFSIINTLMASHLIGDAAVAAIGSTAPLISFISSILWGYGTGVSIYVAMLFGREDYESMANVIKINVILSSVFTVVLSVLSIVMHEQIFDFLNIEESMRHDAFAYFGVYMGGLLFFHINWTCVYFFNAIGLTKMPFINSVISNILNIAGNYILIKFMKMGVEGTAIASVISAMVITAVNIVIFTRLFKKLGIKLRGVYINRNELKKSMVFGFPSTLQQSVMYLCTALVSPLTNLCGANAIAGYTVGMKLYDLNAGIYQNSNKVAATFVAQCMGQKEYSIINKGLKTCILQTLMFLAPFLLATVFGSGMIARGFLEEREGIYYAEIFMKYFMPFVLFNVANNLIHAIFRSSGAGRYLVISTLVYAISRFAYSYLLVGRFEMYGIYAAVALSWITEAIFGGIVFFRGKWKPKDLKDKQIF